MIGTITVFRAQDVGGELLDRGSITLEVTQTSPDGEIELAFERYGNRHYLWFKIQDLLTAALARAGVGGGDV